MDIYTDLLIGFGAAFAAVLLLTPLAKKLAVAVGFVDVPSGRKAHKEPIPPIGGLIVFPVFIAVAVLTGADINHFWPLFAALALVLVVGGIDDYRHISPWIRFVMQFVVAGLIVIPGHAQLYTLGDLFGFGNFDLGAASVPFSIIAVVLLINAINLMDGLDGLAGGKCFVVFSWLALACVLGGQIEALMPIVPLMGAVLGFLFYNMRHPLRGRASIFLGDAGSMSIGVVTAWFAIGLAQEPDPVLVPISIAWILALPIMDICAQFYRRMREGRHPFSPDRGHFHHHLFHAGLSTQNLTYIVIAIALVTGAIGYFSVLLGVPQWVLTFVWVILLFSHMSLSSDPKTYIKFFNQFTKNETRVDFAEKIGK